MYYHILSLAKSENGKSVELTNYRDLSSEMLFKKKPLEMEGNKVSKEYKITIKWRPGNGGNKD